MKIEDFYQGSFDALTSDQAAQEGMARASNAERAQAWKQAAAEWFAALPAGVEFTADDMTRDIGLPDRGANRNNVIGAVFSAAAKRKMIVFTGRVKKSERVDRHVGVHRVWRRA